MPQRTELAEKYAARAVELLQRAIEKGFARVGLMKQDDTLDPIRNREDFKKLLQELEEKTKERKK